MKYFWGLLSSITFGLIPLFSLPILNGGFMEAPSILFWRFLIGAIMILIIALCMGKRLVYRIKDLWHIFLFGLLYALTAIGLFYAYRYIESGICTTMNFTYPIFVCLLMMIFYKEKLTIKVFVSLILSLIGVGLLNWSTGKVEAMGLWFVFLSVICYAVYIILLNKLQVRHIHTFILTAYVLFISSLVVLVLAFLTPQGLQPIQNMNVFWNIIGLVVVATIISNISLVLSAQQAGSTNTAILGAAEPLTAVLVGVIYFHESINFHAILGIILIVGSVCLVIWQPKSKVTSNISSFSQKETFSKSL
ncbi:MAG: DMT family transporter [Bacteroidales bacterium]|nr:DMT family transporter [Bacteroidales bacterium]